MYSPRDYSHHYKSKNIDDGDAQEGTFKPKEYYYYYSYNHPVLCGHAPPPHILYSWLLASSYYVL